MSTLPGRLDPELLVAQTDWVRALVREMVLPDRVDDVVQDTLLAALERPPRARGRRGWDTSGLRSWLRVVARNAALGLLRGERRRRAREEAVALPARVEATDAIVERASVHARVVQAVLALDEPARSTVLMRTFDGLSSAQIARRLGVPAATVRQRLSRGLSKLRRELGVEEPSKRGNAALVGAAWKLAALAAGVGALAWWLAPLWSVTGEVVALQPARQTRASEALVGAVPGSAALANPVGRNARGSVASPNTSLFVVDGRDRRALEGVVVTRAAARERSALAAALEQEWRAAGIGDLAGRWLALAEEEAVPPNPWDPDEPPFAPARESALGRTDAAGRLAIADELPPGSALILRCQGYAPRYVTGSVLQALAVGRRG